MAKPSLCELPELWLLPSTSRLQSLRLGIQEWGLHAAAREVLGAMLLTGRRAWAWSLEGRVKRREGVLRPAFLCGYRKPRQSRIK